MRNRKMCEVKRYLMRFDQILCQMANKMLRTNIVNNITINFIECMIPHHQAAIYMCQNLLEYTEYQPLQEIVFLIESQYQPKILKSLAGLN